MRKIKLNRETKETKIDLSLNLDGTGKSNINTGIGFFDHMLTAFAFNSNIDLNISCIGDLNVDTHHTVEDIGILLGKAINQALSDKKGINRYGNCFLPMDETLVQVCLDISGRSYLVFNIELLSTKVGDFETEMTEEFFRAVAFNAGITLHINMLYGKNTHHIIEAIFKGFGRALNEAIKIDSTKKDIINSTKGII